MNRRIRLVFAAAMAASLIAPPAFAADASDATDTRLGGRNPGIATRSGLEIHKRFRQHLAEPDCRNASPRWRAHYAHAPKRLATRDDELLAVFGYVVDELIKAGLPTEYALIPFIESGYKPGAKSGAGPAGLWQFIALTARNQGIPIRGGYDGRYSVVDSTKAAVRYLKILHSMFGRDWRVAIMGYNAGEYRLIGAIKRSGMTQRNADAERIQGMPALTRAYVEKLHAISCLIEQADDRESWLKAIDRPVPLLAAEVVDEDAANLDAWARARQLDPALLKRLNPALASGGLGGGKQAPMLLAPMRGDRAAVVNVDAPPAKASASEAPVLASAEPSPKAGTAAAASASTSAPASTSTSPSEPTASGTHVVAKGESWWTIARRHKLTLAELLRRNGLKTGTPLRPGMVLKLDAARP